MTWIFDSEFALESLLEIQLEALLGLQILARQYATGGQICDLLALGAEGQLTILELKNGEDRYLVQQLTRYYKYLLDEQPFSGRVDYSKPIRLVAIAPQFHEHNFIDRQFNHLTIQFLQFSIHEKPHQADLYLGLRNIDSQETWEMAIPPRFRDSIHQQEDETAQPIRQIPRLPKSLKTLIDKLSDEKREYILSLRRRFLEFDDRLQEVGRTARTQYGLGKTDKEIYKTKICGEFYREPVFKSIQLRLMLPYPKKQARGQRPAKGYAFAGVPMPEVWESHEMKVHFYLDKKSSMPSFGYSYDLVYYSKLCSHLVGTTYSLQTTEDLIDLALQLWREDWALTDV